MTQSNDEAKMKILNQSQYWLEGINGALYNAIVNFMEKNTLNRTQLAEHLGISKGRVSQILNEGDINFSLEKIIEIALKVETYPKIEFIEQKEFQRKNRGKRSKRNGTSNEVIYST